MVRVVSSKKGRYTFMGSPVLDRSLLMTPTPLDPWARWVRPGDVPGPSYVLDGSDRYFVFTADVQVGTAWLTGADELHLQLLAPWGQVLADGEEQGQGPLTARQEAVSLAGLQPGGVYVLRVSHLPDAAGDPQLSSLTASRRFSVSLAP